MNHRLRILDAEAVRQLIKPEAVIAAVEEAFKLHSSAQGDTYPVVREPLGQGPAPALFGIKSGAIEHERLVGLKAAGFWGHNRSLGRQAHQATILLADSHTGRAYALLDANPITTARTGAAGYIGIRELAPVNAQRICVFGSGVQAKAQLEFALRARPQATRVSYLTRDAQPDTAFEAHFKALCELMHTTNAHAAVESADIIITATPGSAILFDASALHTGQHINAVGADSAGKRELPEGTLSRADHVWVDDLVQAQTLGEMQWMPEADATEIGELLLGEARFTRAPRDLTVFDMTGLALQDLLVARHLYNMALEQQIGHDLDWPW
jgi:alanine dehydrogenase